MKERPESQWLAHKSNARLQLFACHSVSHKIIPQLFCYHALTHSEETLWPCEIGQKPRFWQEGIKSDGHRRMKLAFWGVFQNER